MRYAISRRLYARRVNRFTGALSSMVIVFFVFFLWAVVFCFFVFLFFFSLPIMDEEGMKPARRGNT